jgi:predicted DNA-binding protein (MmcQ/YjbR family)
MKAWSTALGTEIVAWPHVSTRSFFGFTALNRKDRIFALLPRTRGMATANSLAFKLDLSTPVVRARLDQDPRTTSTHMGKARWFAFELSSDADKRSALSWLGTAYEAAGKNKKSN